MLSQMLAIVVVSTDFTILKNLAFNQWTHLSIRVQTPQTIVDTLPQSLNATSGQTLKHKRANNSNHSRTR
jgi:hypothetical protein